jgi:hypothetical protein
MSEITDLMNGPDYVPPIDPRDAILSAIREKEARDAANIVVASSAPGAGGNVTVDTWGYSQTEIAPKSKPDLQADLDATISALRAALATAREALKECADDLESEVEAHYPRPNPYPMEKRRYDRDMEPVRHARSALAAIDAAGKPTQK